MQTCSPVCYMKHKLFGGSGVKRCGGIYFYRTSLYYHLMCPLQERKTSSSKQVDLSVCETRVEMQRLIIVFIQALVKPGWQPQLCPRCVSMTDSTLSQSLAHSAVEVDNAYISILRRQREMWKDKSATCIQFWQVTPTKRVPA